MEQKKRHRIKKEVNEFFRQKTIKIDPDKAFLDDLLNHKTRPVITFKKKRP